MDPRSVAPGNAAPRQPRGMAMPVSRSNLPPSLFPPQANIRLTNQRQQQLRASASNQNRQQCIKTIGLNKNGKRTREPEGMNEYLQEFGALVPKRLHESHGKLVQKSYAFDEAVTTPRVHPVAADLVEAIHLNDHGFFLTSTYGVRHYIWRYTARQKVSGKGAHGHLFGKIPPFSLSFPDSQGLPTTFEQICSTYTYIYACWWRGNYGPGNSSEKFNALFCELAKSKGLKNLPQIKRGWQRIVGYFAEALTKWHKNLDSIEAISFLRATEEFWFDDSVEVSGDAKFSNLFNPMNGARVFYPRESDEKGGISDGHKDRIQARFPLSRRQSDDLSAGGQDSQKSTNSGLEIEGWRFDHTSQGQREACAVRGHPAICPARFHIESPPLLLQPVIPTLWEVANRLSPVEAKTLWHGDMANEFFDFDKAAQDGLCDKAELTGRTKMSQMKLEASPPQLPNHSPPDAKIQDNHLEVLK